MNVWETAVDLKQTKRPRGDHSIALSSRSWTSLYWSNKGEKYQTANQDDRIWRGHDKSSTAPRSIGMVWARQGNAWINWGRMGKGGQYRLDKHVEQLWRWETIHEKRHTIGPTTSARFLFFYQRVRVFHIFVCNKNVFRWGPSGQGGRRWYRWIFQFYYADRHDRYLSVWGCMGGVPVVTGSPSVCGLATPGRAGAIT
jgi:hypothetical protein